jgi:hypothetical protein
MPHNKNIAIFSYLTVISALAFFSFTGHPGARGLANSNSGFAVVELFTSEGCSSCPAADELVAKIQKEAGEKPVYILAFHVDYWNRLGWKDIFSEPAYSNRQQQYSSWLNASVYTPQVVINGQQEFVGSDENRLRSSITSALNKTNPVLLRINSIKETGGIVSLHYQIDRKMANNALVLTLIEKTATSKVLKGENKGRTLSHVQIVRNIRTLSLNEQTEGVTEIEIPAGLDNQSLEIIAFLQSTKNGEITGAAKEAIFK